MLKGNTVRSKYGDAHVARDIVSVERQLCNERS